LTAEGAARYIVDEAVRQGLPESGTAFFEQPEDAGQYIAECLRPGDAVLFKGSRGVALERALAVVQKRFEDAALPSGDPALRVDSALRVKERP
jgi:UDP-N-acetylmuramyl pentapeptide synthase